MRLVKPEKAKGRGQGGYAEEVVRPNFERQDNPRGKSRPSLKEKGREPGFLHQGSRSFTHHRDQPSKEKEKELF